MNLNKINYNGVEIAVVESDDVIMTDTQSALDLVATARYGSNCGCIAIHKSAVIEDFFILSTGVAGEILQKFVTYRTKLAIIGDFSTYTSQPLRDFIYESNHGGHIFFVATEEEALQKLSAAP